LTAIRANVLGNVKVSTATGSGT